MNSTPPRTISSTSARNPRIRIPDLPTLTNSRRCTEIAKVGDGTSRDGVEVQPVTDSTRVTLGFQRRDGSVSAWRVQIIASAVGAVITSGEVMGLGGVGELAQEGVGGAAGGVEADFIDTVGLVGGNGEAGGHSGGGKKGGEVDGEHVDDLDVVSCGVQE